VNADQGQRPKRVARLKLGVRVAQERHFRREIRGPIGPLRTRGAAAERWPSALGAATLAIADAAVCFEVSLRVFVELVDGLVGREAIERARWPARVRGRAFGRAPEGPRSAGRVARRRRLVPRSARARALRRRRSALGWTAPQPRGRGSP
jgi:hypothetical protein